MKSKVVSIRVPEHLDDLAALMAKINHTDKVTAFRQWLHEGAAIYTLKAVADGRISIGKAGELLDLSIWDIQAIAENYHIKYGATEEQLKQSWENVQKILAEEKAKKTSA
jgi:hypothetical protein